jgi:hypothetical protein
MDDNLDMELLIVNQADPIPAITGQVPDDLRQAIDRAVDAWLLRTPSPPTRRAYRLDLDQLYLMPLTRCSSAGAAAPLSRMALS